MGDRRQSDARLIKIGFRKPLFVMNGSFSRSFERRRFKAEEVRFAILALSLLPGSLGILYPAQLLKSFGIYFGAEFGDFPSKSSGGSGQFYCKRYDEPEFLARIERDEKQAHDFDSVAPIYDHLVGLSSVPVIEESLRLIEELAAPNSRILDLSCGPGKEIPSLAALVPEGEIVAVDLSAGMVWEAYRNARARNVANAAFFQADALHLPRHFRGRFDLTFCCNSFHHYPRPLAALKEMRRTLIVGGKALIIDPRLSQIFLISEPIAKWGDPGYVGFYSAKELHRMFMTAGFSDFYWNELLPWVGVSIGTK
jgi:ubiquinone/menaquinone biosynthesis C-methylase UbiE